MIKVFKAIYILLMSISAKASITHYKKATEEICILGHANYTLIYYSINLITGFKEQSTVLHIMLLTLRQKSLLDPLKTNCNPMSAKVAETSSDIIRCLYGCLHCSKKLNTDRIFLWKGGKQGTMQR